MNMIELIQEKYGDTCRLHSPLTKSQYSKAKKYLPTELLNILKISNGIDKIIIDNGKSEVIGSIVFSLSHIRSQTNAYFSEFGGDGFVFSGNDKMEFYVLKPNGTIWVYHYYDLKEEFYAGSLVEFFQKY